MLKNIRFTPSGCQFWNKHIISASGKHFAFCSTLAVYVYEFPLFNLLKILPFPSDMPDTLITSISFSHADPNLLAVATQNCYIIIWDVKMESMLQKVKLNSNVHATQILWSMTEQGLILLSLSDWSIHLMGASDGQTEQVVVLPSIATTVDWNPSGSMKFVVGCENGAVVSHEVRAKQTARIHLQGKPPVTDVKWDLLSEHYFLVSWEDGSMSLFDDQSSQEVTAFQRQTAGIRSIAWVKTVPGGFITSNSKLAAVKLWNVSNKGPLKTIKIGVSAVNHCVHLNNSHYGKEGFLLTLTNGAIAIFDFIKRKFDFHTEANHSETIFDAKFHPRLVNIVATGAFDGTIKVWDLNQMTCKHQLSLNDASQQKFGEVAKGKVVYGLSWAPDGDRIASVCAGGGLHVWSLKKQKCVTSIAGQGPTFRVDWCQTQQEFIVTGSGDFYCLIYQIVGENIKLKRKIPHPQVVYGTQFNPINDNLLATACKDGILRVFSINLKDPKILMQDQPIQFIGHTQKIFNIAWNPQKVNILASGSDDNTIIIWNKDNPNQKSSLTGHTNRVRALVWNTEIAWLLISGSWDTQIRVWDIRNNSCVHVATGHQSDVYAISCHPTRPFIYASTSRDTSFRLWSLEDIIQKLLLNLIITKEWDETIGDQWQTDSQSQLQLNDPRSQPRMNGAMGLQLKHNCLEEQLANNDLVLFYERVMEFFCFDDCQPDFFDLLKVLIQNKAGDISNTVLHYRDLQQAYKSRAQNLEIKSQRLSYDYQNRGVDRQLAAAHIYLKLNQFEKYCECLVKQDQWQTAIAFSPKVSMAYWKQLVQRYQQHLLLLQNVKKDAQVASLVEYSLLARDAKAALKYLAENGQLEESQLVAASVLQSKFLPMQHEEIHPMQKQKDEDNCNYNYNSSSIVIENMAKMALVQSEKLLKKGHIIASACHHLAMNDVHGAVVKLLRGNQPFYLYILSQLPLNNNNTIDLDPDGQQKLQQSQQNHLLHITSHLALKASNLHHRLLSLQIFDQTISSLNQHQNQNLDELNSQNAANNETVLQQMQMAKHLFISSTPNTSPHELETLYSFHQMKYLNEYDADAQAYFKKGEILLAFQHFLLATNYNKAIDIYLDQFKKCLHHSGIQYLQIVQVHKMQSFLQYCDVSKLDEMKKIQTLIGSNYIGLQTALSKGLLPVIHPIYRNIKHLIRSHQNYASQLQISLHQIRVEYYMKSAHLNSKVFFSKVVKLRKSADQITDNAAILASLNRLEENLKQTVLKYSKIKKIQNQMKRNQVYLSGSDVPADFRDKSNHYFIFNKESDNNLSNNKFDIGNNQFISLQEAIMWKQCIPYCPINDGEIIQCE